MCVWCLVIPEFVNPADGPRDLNVTDGDDVIINCRANADPVATVVWYINGNTFVGKTATIFVHVHTCIDLF